MFAKHLLWVAVAGKNLPVQSTHHGRDLPPGSKNHSSFSSRHVTGQGLSNASKRVRSPLDTGQEQRCDQTLQLMSTLARVDFQVLSHRAEASADLAQAQPSNIATQTAPEPTGSLASHVLEYVDA